MEPPAGLAVFVAVEQIFPSKASSASFSVEVEQPEQRHKPAVGAPELEFCFRSVQTSKPAWL